MKIRLTNYVKSEKEEYELKATYLENILEVLPVAVDLDVIDLFFRFRGKEYSDGEWDHLKIRGVTISIKED